MAAQPSLLDWSAFLPALREAVRAAPAPLTAAQARAALAGRKKPPAVDVQALLDEDAARGEVYRWEPATGKTPRYWAQPPEAVARPLLLQSLAAADEPLTADEYRKRAGIDASAASVKRLLEELVAEGRCRRYEPVKKDQHRYWAGDPDRYARRVMLAVLAKGKGKSGAPMSWSELSKALKAPLQGYSEDRLSQLLQEMLDAREAFKALSLTPGADRYGTRPPDLAALVRASLAELHKKFAKVGVTPEAFDEAAREVLGTPSREPAVDLAGAVMNAFAELKRERFGHSGLVPIPAVRRGVAAAVGPHAARHDVLDGVIKGLVKEGRLRIIPLGDAAGVSDQDRADAIPGLQETWYYLESRS